MGSACLLAGEEVGSGRGRGGTGGVLGGRPVRGVFGAGFMGVSALVEEGGAISRPLCKGRKGADRPRPLCSDLPLLLETGRGAFPQRVGKQRAAREGDGIFGCGAEGETLGLGSVCGGRGGGKAGFPSAKKDRCSLAAAFLAKGGEGRLALWGQMAWAGVYPLCGGEVARGRGRHGRSPPGCSAARGKGQGL